VTLVVARVVGALERVVQGQQRSLAEYREGLLAASQDAGDGLVQLTNATSDTGAAPRRLPSYPSYDDSVGTSEGTAEGAGPRAEAEPPAPERPAEIPPSRSLDRLSVSGPFPDDDSIAVSESASQQVAWDRADSDPLFAWVESHVSKTNVRSISRYAQRHRDEVNAVIQSSFQRKEELLVAMARRPC